METPAVATAKAPAWHEALPAPRNTSPGSITRDELLELLKEGNGEVNQRFVLVDVRRADYEGGTIHSSINLPAQSLYHTIPRLYTLFRAAGVERVIWYCGSSRGRGTRCAGWFDDHIQSQVQDSATKKMESIILLGGITGWANAGEQFVAMMDGYECEAWARKDK